MKNVALITGASSGLGREFALIHAEKTGDVVITARREENLLELKKEIESKFNREVYIIAKDLSLENAPIEIYDELKSKNIIVDYLINNAGFGGVGLFHERSYEDDVKMIELNVVSLTKLTKLFLPDMINRNSGKVLNVASTAGMVPGPLQVVYYATKAYVKSFSEGISGELLGTNVTSTSLCPGPVKTEFGKVSGMENTKGFKKTYDAKDVALDGYNGMVSGKITVVTGISFTNKILLRMNELLPKTVLLKEVRKFQEKRKDL